ncbi:MAG: DUF305 domain-containing protein [Candidatus Nanoarchaeia archaeon]
MRWQILILFLLVACTAQVDNLDHMMIIDSEESFIVNMIPHHQEAVDTARLVVNSPDPEMPDFANSIIQAQESEIAMMEQWLADWYPDHQQAKYMNMMPDLKLLDPAARDYPFLVGMIDHHSGAIEMSEQVLKLNPRPEVKGFAEKVIEDQSNEIKLMQGWLAD